MNPAIPFIAIAAFGLGFLFADHLALLREDAIDDALRDLAYGDAPHIPSDFKASVHSASVTEGGQQDHG